MCEGPHIHSELLRVFRSISGSFCIDVSPMSQNMRMDCNAMLILSLAVEVFVSD